MTLREQCENRTSRDERDCDNDRGEENSGIICDVTDVSLSLNTHAVLSRS